MAGMKMEDIIGNISEQKYIQVMLPAEVIPFLISHGYTPITQQNPADGPDKRMVTTERSLVTLIDAIFRKLVGRQQEGTKDTMVGLTQDEKVAIITEIMTELAKGDYDDVDLERMFQGQTNRSKA